MMETSGSPANPLRVLVVDDEENIRRILKINLQTQSCQVDEARNGEEALDLLEMERYDLVFVDIMMPYLDGYSVVAKLRQGQGPNRDAPVVAVTALRSDLDRQRADELGFIDYVPKPFQAKQIRAVVQRLRAARDRGGAEEA